MNWGMVVSFGGGLYDEGGGRRKMGKEGKTTELAKNKKVAIGALTLYVCCWQRLDYTKCYFKKIKKIKTIKIKHNLFKKRSEEKDHYHQISPHTHKLKKENLTMRLPLTMRSFPVLALLLLALYSSLAQGYTQVCRCSCASNYTIFEMPDDGLSYAQTCLNCTKKFCISQDLDICKGFDESLVQATCFQRESIKEQFFIYIFIIVTSLLLGYAAVSPYFTKNRAAVS